MDQWNPMDAGFDMFRDSKKEAGYLKNLGLHGDITEATYQVDPDGHQSFNGEWTMNYLQ
jgi:hypothetical protein